MMTSAFDELLNLERVIDDMFDGAPVPVRFAPAQSAPAMTIAEEKEGFVATMDLPGVKKEDLKIGKTGNTLTISGERKRTSLPDGASWLRNETWNGTFSRSIELPDGINDGAISAELTNGVLRIFLPKAEAAKPREIAIR